MSADSLALTNQTNVVQFSWPSKGPGYSYALQIRSNLISDIWLPVEAKHPWPVASNLWNTSITGSAGFFRLLTVTAATRGNIEAASIVYELSQTDLNGIFDDIGLGITAQSGVRFIKLNYETLDADGGKTIASAIMCVPTSSNINLPLVTYLHGTIARKADAPSRMNLNSELIIGAIFSSAGYATLLPDYIGLGDSPGFHPYHHSISEATASVDAMRACRQYSQTNAITYSGKLFLCGYSQGGHATLALLKAIEQFHTDEFAVTAAAPMAGAYSLSGVMIDDFLSRRAPPNPFYYPYILNSYCKVYGIAASFSDILRPPYDATLPALLDGEHSDAAINQAMPAVPLDMLKPEWIADLTTNSHHVFRQALKHNDLIGWRPVAPIRLYHCAGDQDVPIENTIQAYDSFVAAGATDIQKIDPSPTSDHEGGFFPSIIGAKSWFDSLR